MKTISEIFFKARVALLALRIEELKRWQELHAALIQAAGAHEEGDRIGVAACLSKAADIEHELTGDCKAVGSVMDALGIDDEDTDRSSLSMDDL
jgi:hypothetical protein